MRLLLLLTFLGLGVIAIRAMSQAVPVSNVIVEREEQTPSPTLEPTPTSIPDIPFVAYPPAKLPKKSAYRIILLGDSMTAALGPYADQFRRVIEKKYPDIGLIVENQSAPSSNIESLQDRLLTRATESGASYDPVLGKPFDIIVIESFGYNPLSYLGRQEGLNKANQSLTTAMRLLTREQPNALIVFLATIAPSHTMYGVGSVKLNLSQREEWATERALYIENHIAFAKEHTIPLVDVYHKTTDKNGNGLLKYINPTDHIHPSQVGVNLIQDTLAQYLIETKVFE